MSEAPAPVTRKAVMVRMPPELHERLMAARSIEASMNDLCIKFIEQGLEKLQSPSVLSQPTSG